MSILRSITVFLLPAAVPYPNANALMVRLPTLPPIQHPPFQTFGLRETSKATATTASMSTTARTLFARRRDRSRRRSSDYRPSSPSLEPSELSSQDRRETYDSDVEEEEEEEEGAAGGDTPPPTNGLYDEITEKIEYLDDPDDPDDDDAAEHEYDTGYEDGFGDVASEMIFSDSPAFSITKFLSSSFSFLRSGNSSNNNNTDDTKKSARKRRRIEGWYSPYTLFTNDDTDNTIQWDVFVDQSKASIDRGAIATLDSFHALSPPNIVRIHPAILSKTKGKGPSVRCIRRRPSPSTTTTPHPSAFEVNNVNDVDKVFLILTQHMNVSSVSTTARSCLKWTYRGNAYLEQDNIPLALRAYDRALSPNNLHPPHEGSLLLLRATAYLRRATHHQTHLRTVVQDLTATVPDPIALGRLFRIAREQPTLTETLFRRFLSETRTMHTAFRQTKYSHGLYEYSLLHAARDSLRATQLMPESAEAYLRAADSLAELRKLKESVSYYERAMELDPALEGRIRPVVERLMRSWEGLERAKAMGWSGDTLRLALDVAG